MHDTVPFASAPQRTAETPYNLAGSKRTARMDSSRTILVRSWAGLLPRIHLLGCW